MPQLTQTPSPSVLRTPPPNNTPFGASQLLFGGAVTPSSFVIENIEPTTCAVGDTETPEEEVWKTIYDL